MLSDLGEFVRIKDGDQHKAAFKTKYGLYEPNVMFFGLTNSPATFQAMMDHILQPWGDKWAEKGIYGSWYMDDVLVASRDKKKHQQATHELLDILEANDLFLSVSKASCCLSPHVHGVSFLVSSFNGLAIWENW